MPDDRTTVTELATALGMFPYPDVRVALAIGPVLVQDGDFYGPVVNLASRAVAICDGNATATRVSPAITSSRNHEAR